MRKDNKHMLQLLIVILGLYGHFHVFTKSCKYIKIAASLQSIYGLLAEWDGRTRSKLHL